LGAGVVAGVVVAPAAGAGATVSGGAWPLAMREEAASIKTTLINAKTYLDSRVVNSSATWQLISLYYS